MKGIPNETRFTVEGHEMTLGQTVWTRELMWGPTWGTGVRERYGVYRVIEGCSFSLTLRHARKPHSCDTCHSTIDVAEMHGAGSYGGAHYCLDCVTPLRPETQWKVPA